MQKLTGKQVRHLRALGHHLNPIIMVGKGEISDSLVASLEDALLHHELVKVKLQEGCDLDRKEVAAILSEKTESEIAQIIGKTILLYRKSEDPVIELP